jgi:ferrous iron transport protein B
MQQPLTIMLIGAPNVGKSMIFNYLTGMYVTVSNYPGTTVDVSRGKLVLDGLSYEVVDTPGVYSLIPMTDEERVTRELLCDGKPKLIIHVVDAKHIHRMTHLTLELLDGEFPVIVDLNVMDEAEQLGMSIDSVKLSEALGVPVIKTSAINRSGLEQLKQAIRQYRFRHLYRTGFDSELETSIAAIGDCIEKPSAYGMSPRLIALLLLQGDAAVRALVKREVLFNEILQLVNQATKQNGQQLSFAVTAQRQAAVERILRPCVLSRQINRRIIGETASRLTREPLTGIPILLLVLYFGLYLFVGRLGAGVLVDYFDKVIFGSYLLPTFTAWVSTYIPFEPLQTLLMGEFGIISLGLRYAIAIILPVVSTFFLTFALLEDSGYLPRLAMLLNEICRWFGLNGRAVIPLSLGFGCGTMAVMVTRTLETKRERLLATFLLSLAVPCSAQLGVILALLSRNVIALLLWIGVITAVFLVAGLLANRLLPGKPSLFYMELPPIRLPRPGNVIVKAYSRMVWYMKEIIPVFICVSGVLWLGERMGWLQLIADRFQPVLSLVGLPSELAPIFLLGFFRRDYGAAGLYNAAMDGVLTVKQLLVAAVALTLFLPCVAQLVVMVKERGPMVSLLLLALIALLSFFVAWLVYALVNPAWF